MSRGGGGRFVSVRIGSTNDVGEGINIFSKNWSAMTNFCCRRILVEDTGIECVSRLGVLFDPIGEQLTLCFRNSASGSRTTASPKPG